MTLRILVTTPSRTPDINAELSIRWAPVARAERAALTAR
jgi:hypothetical protein